MTLEFELSRVAPDGVLVIEGVTRDNVPAEPAVAASGFEGAPGSTVFSGDRLLVGLGNAEEASDDATIRRAAGAAARTSRRVERVATTLPPTQAAAEGFALGTYSFTKYRGKPDERAAKLREVTFVGGGGARAKTALERGARVADAVTVARDLVNEPGGALTPPVLADRVAEVAKAAGLKVKVLDEGKVEKADLQGLLAVNRGSTQPPRWVELTYEPPTESRATVALVGKGITFDSGGLSMKSPEGMMTMKSDMGGAAAIAGALSAAGDLGVKVRVRAFLPITDNMTGGDAQRVGDVIRYNNGTTAEVLNTDAEGRLILADGLIAASAEEPAAIIDLATLTGACIVALGRRMAGLFSNNDGLAEQIQAAADAAGEPMWQLPLVRAYARDLDSKVADVANIGRKAGGGAITAALFLQKFVGDGVPWAHLDIAGPAFSDDDDGEVCAGGTGYGVRTLLAFLTKFKRP
jgi:leucyl aminopeptidase